MESKPTGRCIPPHLRQPGHGGAQRFWLNNSLAYCTFEPKANAMDGRARGTPASGRATARRSWCALAGVGRNLGTPGGHTIGQTVPQMIMNLIAFRIDIAAAIDRLHRRPPAGCRPPSFPPIRVERGEQPPAPSTWTPEGIMETYKWRAAYDIGLDLIDRQHRALVDLLNQITVQAASGSSGALDPALVDRLEWYVTDHFRLEEEWMAAAGYEELDRHRRQHQVFAARVQELREAPQNVAPTRLSSTAAFLREWFIHHILGDDKLYAPVVIPWEAQRLAFG